MNRACSVCKCERSRNWCLPPNSPGPVVRCTECGFVFVNPIEQDKSLVLDGPVLGDCAPELLTCCDLERIKGSWIQPIIERYIDELQAKRLNASSALDRINRLMPGRGNLLDVGCFCGVFLDVASKDGWSCCGVEPLVMPAVYARGTFGLNVITNTLENAGLETGAFDVITYFQVFEHLVNPNDEMSEIHRLLKVGGLLAIEVPNVDTFTVRLMGKKHRHFVMDHVNFFSIATMTRFLDRHGFVVRSVSYPRRMLSLEHLSTWIGQLGGRRVSDITSRLFRRLNIQSRMLSVGLGDIMLVIAEKKRLA